MTTTCGVFTDPINCTSTNTSCCLWYTNTSVCTDCNTNSTSTSTSSSNTNNTNSSSIIPSTLLECEHGILWIGCVFIGLVATLYTIWLWVSTYKKKHKGHTANMVTYAAVLQNPPLPTDDEDDRDMTSSGHNLPPNSQWIQSSKEGHLSSTWQQGCDVQMLQETHSIITHLLPLVRYSTGLLLLVTVLTTLTKSNKISCFQKWVHTGPELFVDWVGYIVYLMWSVPMLTVALLIVRHMSGLLFVPSLGVVTPIWAVVLVSWTCQGVAHIIGYGSWSMTWMCYTLLYAHMAYAVAQSLSFVLRRGYGFFPGRLHYTVADTNWHDFPSAEHGTSTPRLTTYVNGRCMTCGLSYMCYVIPLYLIPLVFFAWYDIPPFTAKRVDLTKLVMIPLISTFGLYVLLLSGFCQSRATRATNAKSVFHVLFLLVFFCGSLVYMRFRCFDIYTRDRTVEHSIVMISAHVFLQHWADPKYMQTMYPPITRPDAVNIPELRTLRDTVTNQQLSLLSADVLHTTE
jgi:hypothetical protein